jgi:hypothetical protein
VAWQHDVISALWDKLADNGAIFFNHKPRVIGAKLWLPLELLPAETILRQIIIWARPGGMNFNPITFVPTHEWIMVLAKKGRGSESCRFWVSGRAETIGLRGPDFGSKIVLLGRRRASPGQARWG